MNSSEKARYEKNWTWAKQYWVKKVKELNIKGWRMGTNHAKLSLGECNHGKKIVLLSSHFLRGPSCDQNAIRDTILHEIAHILCGPYNSHNAYWKKVAKRIGCNGEKYGQMDQPPPNYIMYCPKGCFKQPYYRRPKIDGRKCLKCKSKPILKSVIKKQGKKHEPV